jgi:hypothetical protein
LKFMTSYIYTYGAPLSITTMCLRPSQPLTYQLTGLLIHSLKVWFIHLLIQINFIFRMMSSTKWLGYVNEIRTIDNWIIVQPCNCVNVSIFKDMYWGSSLVVAIDVVVVTIVSKLVVTYFLESTVRVIVILS